MAAPEGTAKFREETSCSKRLSVVLHCTIYPYFRVVQVLIAIGPVRFGKLELRPIGYCGAVMLGRTMPRPRTIGRSSWLATPQAMTAVHRINDMTPATRA